MSGIIGKDALVVQSPVTPEMAMQAMGWKDFSSLVRDSDRAAFMAVWALLAWEYADAVYAEGLSRRRAEVLL